MRSARRSLISMLRSFSKIRKLTIRPFLDRPQHPLKMPMRQVPKKRRRRKRRRSLSNRQLHQRYKSQLKYSSPSLPSKNSTRTIHNNSKTSTNKSPSKISATKNIEYDTRMAISMKARCKTPWKMVGEIITINQARNIQDASSMMRSMATVGIIFCREQNIKEIGVAAWSTGLEYWNLPIKTYIRAVLVTMTCMERECTGTIMAMFSMVSFGREKDMEMECLKGQMEGTRRENG